MKPHRLTMTHTLVLEYGLYKKMEVYRPQPAEYSDLARFHSADYLDFLQRVTPDNSSEALHQLTKFNLGPYTDCPIFDGIFDFCKLYSGGSIDGAQRLNHGLTDIAVNWSGGLHHAKKSEASGFCYVNDIVLAILELLKYHARVLYIDIDIHHGDGVEEAFYTSNRVMTVSFHKFGDFFPGTGDLCDTGVSQGHRYAVNFPMHEGIDDQAYLSVFKPVIQKVMEMYRPGAVVLQCGADSLTGDRLGCFNLTVKGHGEAVEFVKSFGLPTLVLGGGGYNIRNVSRCWAYETSVVLSTPISNNIPYNDFFQCYGPDFKLHLTPADIPNLNSRHELEKTKTAVLQNLSFVEHAPAVQMQEVPSDTFLMDARRALEEEEDDQNFDAPRVGQAHADAQIDDDAEFFDDDKDNDGEDLPDLVDRAESTRAKVELGGGPAPRRSIMTGKGLSSDDRPVLGKRPASAVDDEEPLLPEAGGPRQPRQPPAAPRPKE